jgi:hypothetical protein
MSRAVTTDVTNHKKNGDYIYISDPQFHLMYGEYGRTLQYRVACLYFFDMHVHNSCHVLSLISDITLEPLFFFNMFLATLY